jgi:hypothetical protein
MDTHPRVRTADLVRARRSATPPSREHTVDLFRKAFPDLGPGVLPQSFTLTPRHPSVEGVGWLGFELPLFVDTDGQNPSDSGHAMWASVDGPSHLLSPADNGQLWVMVGSNPRRRVQLLIEVDSSRSGLSPSVSPPAPVFEIHPGTPNPVVIDATLNRQYLTLVGTTEATREGPPPYWLVFVRGLGVSRWDFFSCTVSYWEPGPPR